jgi:hypothetical protein
MAEQLREALYRKRQFQEALGGIGHSFFHRLQRRGIIPAADAWFSATLPLWKQSTVEATVARVIEEFGAIGGHPDAPAKARAARQAKPRTEKVAA